MARTILDLYQDWEERLNAARAPANAHRAAKLLQHHIALDARTVERELPVSAQTAYNQLNTLVRLGIAEELDSAHLGRRVYIAHELVALLSTD